MRSLAWRWAIAVIVGSLWGAVIPPGKPARLPDEATVRPARAETTQCPAIQKGIAALTIGDVNAMSF